MYVFGGSTTTTVSDLFKYDLILNTWSLIYPSGISIDRSIHAAFLFQNNYMIVFGGYSYSLGSYLDDVQILDFTSYSWLTVNIDGTNPPGKNHFGAIVNGNSLTIYGGYNCNFFFFNKWLLFTYFKKRYNIW